MVDASEPTYGVVMQAEMAFVTCNLWSSHFTASWTAQMLMT